MLTQGVTTPSSKPLLCINLCNAYYKSFLLGKLEEKSEMQHDQPLSLDLILWGLSMLSLPETRLGAHNLGFHLASTTQMLKSTWSSNVNQKQGHYSVLISLPIMLSSSPKHKGFSSVLPPVAVHSLCYHLHIHVLLTSYSVNSNTQTGKLFCCAVLEIYFISRDLASLHILLF